MGKGVAIDLRARRQHTNRSRPGLRPGPIAAHGPSDRESSPRRSNQGRVGASAIPRRPHSRSLLPRPKRCSPVPGAATHPPNPAADLTDKALKPSRLANLTFPHCEYAPPKRAESRAGAAITLRVTCQLFMPEPSIGRRQVGEAAPAVPMPETTVYKYDGAVTWEKNVRVPGKFSRMHAVSEPCAMEVPTYRQLGTCIARANPGHHATARARIHYVHGFLISWPRAVGRRAVREASRRPARAAACAVPPPAPPGLRQRSRTGDRRACQTRGS